MGVLDCRFRHSSDKWLFSAALKGTGLSTKPGLPHIPARDLSPYTQGMESLELSLSAVISFQKQLSRSQEALPASRQGVTDQIFSNIL